MIKVASSQDLPIVESIMKRIHDEDPSYWPYGLDKDQFNGGLYLVKESNSSEPVGFVGWQRFQELDKNVGYYAVGILPEYRECGFAKSAVAQLIREASTDCDTVRAMIVKHNEPSKALARSLGVTVIEKIATMTKESGWRKDLAGALAGALGTTVFFDQTANTDRTIGSSFQPWQWDKERALMGGLNAMIGAIGGQRLANKDILTGLGAITMAPAKDLVLKGINSLHHIDEAAIEGAKTFAHDRAKAEPVVPKNMLESVPTGVWAGAGALGLGAIGMALYNAKKKRDLEEKALAQAAAGVAHVTLPTKNPGDIETRIQLPVGDLNLSNAVLQNLGRDTRRRLRQETRGRTQRRKSGDGEPTPEQIGELVDEINKRATTASGVPTPPQIGQNPAMRMQNQQQATANSITPPPAANPAVMQAEQKAMQVEQTATQQQAQTEQASQQAQMEMEQRFQQELAKHQQEKDILRLQLEKSKVLADLQKAQMKASDEINKAKVEGQNSTSSSESSAVSRLLQTRIDRLHRRVGSTKVAAVTGDATYYSDSYGRPGSINPATGATFKQPKFQHIKPQGAQMYNDGNPSRSIPKIGVYRTSYGHILDGAYDLFLKNMMQRPKQQTPRVLSQTDIATAPDQMSVIRDIYGGMATTSPLDIFKQS